MGKLLFWALVIIGGLLLARVLARYHEKSKLGDTDTAESSRKAAPKPLESMVRCEHCGIHLPRSEATQVNGKVWCSEEHARLGNDT